MERRRKVSDYLEDARLLQNDLDLPMCSQPPAETDDLWDLPHVGKGVEVL